MCDALAELTVCATGKPEIHKRNTDSEARESGTNAVLKPRIEKASTFFLALLGTERITYREDEHDVKDALKNVERVERRGELDVLASLLLYYAQENADMKVQKASFAREFHSVPPGHRAKNR